MRPPTGSFSGLTVQSEYNSESNRDIKGLDITIEGVEDKIKEIHEELEWIRMDIEEWKEAQEKMIKIIAKLVAAVAVLEGQIEQQRQLINHQMLIGYA